MNVQRGLPGSCNSVNSQQASETFKLVRRYTETIHIGVAHDGKDVLARLSYEDRPQVFKSRNAVESSFEFRGPKGVHTEAGKGVCFLNFGPW